MADSGSGYGEQNRVTVPPLPDLADELRGAAGFDRSAGDRDRQSARRHVPKRFATAGQVTTVHQAVT